MLNVIGEKFALSGHDLFTDDDALGIDFCCDLRTLNGIVISDRNAINTAFAAESKQRFWMYTTVFRKVRVAVQFNADRRHLDILLGQGASSFMRELFLVSAEVRWSVPGWSARGGFLGQ